MRIRPEILAAATVGAERDDIEVSEEGGALYFIGAPGTYTLTYVGAGPLFDQKQKEGVIAYETKQTVGIRSDYT